jgi:hypothetical protein
MTSLPKAKVRARARRRGAVLVEYSLVLAFVAMPTVAGIIAGGVSMLREYRAGRDAMLQSNP